MTSDRRHFLKLAGGSVAATAAAAVKGEQQLTANGWRATVSETGEVVSLRSGSTELVDRRLGDSHLRVSIAAGPPLRCDRPVSSRRGGAALVFEYHAGAVSVEMELRLAALDGQAAGLIQKVTLRAASKISDDVTLEAPRNIRLPVESRQFFVPLRNGVGRTVGMAGGDYLFELSGGHRLENPERLAVPVVDEFASGTDLRITVATDPWFGSAFRLPAAGKPASFHCTWLGKIGLQAPETRTIVTGLHRRNFDQAMQVFYQACLADVKAGPAWTHDVALIDYDYLSQRGKGWFSDIDKLAEVIKPADRPQILLALHGWYDYVGRYCFNYRTRSFDKRWVAFPSARGPEVQGLAKAPDQGPKWGKGWRRSTLDNLYPYDMSWTDMHRRIRYAKNKGFRVALYYADGISAANGLGEIYDPAKVLRWGGWVGPDTKGKPYAQNPLHPEVYDFYKSYMQALLAEVGKEVDGFVWDETFYVFAGDLGTQAVPGYADRSMMRLVKDVAGLVAAASPQLAFFASDDLRPFQKDKQIPTALGAHGTYQDSACMPDYWPYGLFPNYRNALWSCNWFPITGYAFTKYAVDTFDTPSVISDGYGDNIGFAQMQPPDFRRIIDLFDERKRRPMRLTWVEEKGGALTYRGKPLKTKRDLMPA